MGAGRISCEGEEHVLAEVAFTDEKFTDHTIPKYFQTKIIDKVKEYWTKENEFRQKTGHGGPMYEPYYYDVYQQEDL